MNGHRPARRLRITVTKLLLFTEQVSWISSGKFARLKRNEGVSTKLVLKTAAMLAMSILAGATANSGDLNVTAPILGNYPKTSVSLSADTTVTPDSAPTNTTSINVSRSEEHTSELQSR